MNIKIKKAVCLVIVFVMLSASLNIAYANDDKLKLEFTLNSSTAYIDNEATTVEKPYMSENIIYLPLKVIMESFGAEIVNNADDGLNIIYRGKEINIKPGDVHYTVNQHQMEMPGAPQVKNNVIMVPLELLKDNFIISDSFDKNKNKVTIILEDAGALTDLSFLTGSITKQSVGNSYFGWSVSVPKNSNITSTSFNSSRVYIENEKRELDISISVEKSDGKTLNEIYNEIKDNPMETLYISKIYSSSIDKDNNGEYAEFLYNDWGYYGVSSIIYRIYLKGDYLYEFTISCNELDPSKIKTNKYCAAILNSIRLDYDGSDVTVQDTSKVKAGMIKYKYYEQIDYEKKILLWEMDVLPEWEFLGSYSISPFSNSLGNKPNESVTVNVLKADEDATLEHIQNVMYENIDKLYNKQYYKFSEKEITKLADYDAVKLTYFLTIGKKNFTVYDYYILHEGLIYNVCLSVLTDDYKNKEETYRRVLQSFEINNGAEEDIKKEIESYLTMINMDRVSDSDEPFEYVNKEFLWKAHLPGYWLKYEYIYDRSYTNFYNLLNGCGIEIICIPNSQINPNATDEDIFGFEDYGKDMKLVESKDLNEKNTTVRYYKYRIEDEENLIYADIVFYVLKGKKNTYCFTIYVQDIYNNETFKNEYSNAWNTFTIDISVDKE